MIYTAICGGIDQPRTDIKCFGGYDKFKDPRRNAKIYKVLSHFFDPDEISVWVDGNIFPNMTLEQYARCLGDKDIAMIPHPERDNIYLEAEVCKAWGKDDPAAIDGQIARYKDVKGLWAGGLIIRRHTEDIRRRNERWWAEICAGSVRDQLSIPYVFGDIIKSLDRVNLKDNNYFKRNGHKT